MTTGAQVDITGPFFDVDVEKTLLQNVERMMQGIADEGAIAAKANLEAGSDRRALIRMTQDRLADHVIGRTVALSGKQWMTAAVVQVQSAGLSRDEARSLLAAASYVEGKTRSIRRVATQLRSARAVLTANLTAGMGD